MSDTRVYAPQIRARLGTTAQVPVQVALSGQAAAAGGLVEVQHLQDRPMSTPLPSEKGTSLVQQGLSL